MTFRICPRFHVLRLPWWFHSDYVSETIICSTAQKSSAYCDRNGRPVQYVLQLSSFLVSFVCYAINEWFRRIHLVLFTRVPRYSVSIRRPIASEISSCSSPLPIGRVSWRGYEPPLAYRSYDVLNVGMKFEETKNYNRSTIVCLTIDAFDIFALLLVEVVLKRRRDEILCTSCYTDNTSTAEINNRNPNFVPFKFSSNQMTVYTRTVRTYVWERERKSVRERRLTNVQKHSVRIDYGFTVQVLGSFVKNTYGRATQTECDRPMVVCLLYFSVR